MAAVVGSGRAGRLGSSLLSGGLPHEFLKGPGLPTPELTITGSCLLLPNSTVMMHSPSDLPSRI